MRYRLTGVDGAVIIFGRGATEFEFALDVGALHDFVRLGVEALNELGSHTESDALTFANEMAAHH